MKYPFLIFVAGSIFISLWLSISGEILGTYFILGLLGINVGLVIWNTSTTMGLLNTLLKTSSDQNEQEKTKSQDQVISLFIQLMMLACVWHIFTLETYVFFSGVATVTALITVLVTVFKLLEKRYLD
jgi:hypothetical protein